METKTIYKFYILLFLISFSCSDDNTPIVAEEQEENPTEELEMLTQEELDYITNLLIVDDKMGDFWLGFDYIRTHPIYIVTGKNEGIFINPPASEISNSRKIFNEIDGFEGLEMYRNNELLAFAKDDLQGSFFFPFAEFNGFNIYLYDITQEPTGFYFEYKNRNGYFHVSIFYHELFHLYQSDNGELFYGEVYPNSFLDFPITEDSLPLLMLLFDVMIDAYDLETEAAQRKHLSYYVSIASKLEIIDTTQNNLIRNYGFLIEKSEGSARYVEVFSTLNTLNNNTIEDPTHGFKEYTNNITNSMQLRQAYGRRIFYHTGAGVIQLLKQLQQENIELLYFSSPIKPYDIAANFLSLSTSEKEILLEEVKVLYNWEDIEERADYLLSL